VAEHDGRLLCAGCLREVAGSKGQAAGRRSIRTAAALAMAAALCWLWFLLAGEALVAARPMVEAGEWRQR
jgi:hypothetical protein